MTFQNKEEAGFWKACFVTALETEADEQFPHLRLTPARLEECGVVADRCLEQLRARSTLANMTEVTVHPHIESEEG
jgi:hypothetical protein